MFTFTLAFALALLISVATRLWLATRHARHIAQHRASVPAAFSGTMSLAAHQKAADYSRANLRLGLLELLVGSAVLLGWTLLGGLNALNQFLAQRWGVGMGQQLALFASFALIGGIIDLPFSLYRTFVLEEKFGFNKTSFKLWLADGVKGLLLGAALGLPLLALVLWLMAQAGSLWWLWAWVALVAFQVLMLLIFPTFIAPLFNKFAPLTDEALKARAQKLMQEAGFAAKGFFVMDGSRRSAHANAYFTGLGKSKRVVFFDTLLAKLSHAEVDAVLAHELGHFKHKHIAKRMLLAFVMSFLGFALLGYLAQQTWFYAGLGVLPNLPFSIAQNGALALLLFALVVPVFSFFLTPLSSYFSRKDEFEADRYAVAQTSGQDLGQALLKLYEDNASTLTPDPWYVRFYYSHPPAIERLAAMGYRNAAA